MASKLVGLVARTIDGTLKGLSRSTSGDIADLEGVGLFLQARAGGGTLCLQGVNLALQRCSLGVCLSLTGLSSLQSFSQALAQAREQSMQIRHTPL